MSEQSEPLKDLLEHPGWAAFVAHVHHEWGAGGMRFEGFINRFADSREDDPVVLQQIRQIAVARREILRLLEWPAETVAHQKKQDAVTDHHPRKPMPLELVGQGRRGGL